MFSTVIFCKTGLDEFTLQDKLILSERIRERHNALYADIIYIIEDRESEEIEFGFNIPTELNR